MGLPLVSPTPGSQAAAQNHPPPGAGMVPRVQGLRPRVGRLPPLEELFPTTLAPGDSQTVLLRGMCLHRGLLCVALEILGEPAPLDLRVLLQTLKSRQTEPRPIPPHTLRYLSLKPLFFPLPRMALLP